MSSTVLLRVVCDRCDKQATLEPVAKALREAKEINANASADSLELHKLTERPAGWGIVNWRRADRGGSTTRELCADCFEMVLATLNRDSVPPP